MDGQYRNELEQAAREAILERKLGGYDLDRLSELSDLELKGILDLYPAGPGMVLLDDGWFDLPGAHYLPDFDPVAEDEESEVRGLSPRDEDT